MPLPLKIPTGIMEGVTVPADWKPTYSGESFDWQQLHGKHVHCLLYFLCRGHIKCILLTYSSRSPVMHRICELLMLLF